MVEKEVRVWTRLGLHARPAILFVQKANEFACHIRIAKADKEANAKSISQLLSLKIRQNDQIQLRAYGEEEAEAVEALMQLLVQEPCSDAGDS